MTTTEAPTKLKRKPRKGPPNVPCPQCFKLAGAEDEGIVDDLEVSVDGDASSVTVTIDTATLMLKTACCGVDYKSYDLSGNSKEAEHACEVITAQEEAQANWNEHCDFVCMDECDKESITAHDNCEDGNTLAQELSDINTQVQADSGDWEITDEGEPEAYQRTQREARIRSTGKSVPIKSYRYAKSYRGITLTTTVKHGLCDQEETVAFEEGDAEAQSSSFDTV